jgi:16S rRNA (uracil1498-N3)-methyltransferase
MRKPRIYTEQALKQDLDITLEPEASRHIIQVLRLRVGSNLVLFNGDGFNYSAQLESTAKKQARVLVLSCSGPESESLLNIHLCLAISKGERMDFAIQKSVELGVNEITPLFSQYGVVNLQGERLHKREQHWRRVITSACEQSGRFIIPILNSALRLEIWLAMPREGTGLILDPKS